MYLAHYDLVTQEQGRSFLKEVGLTRDLIRISVGIEPYEEIEAVSKRIVAAVEKATGGTLRG